MLQRRRRHSRQSNLVAESLERRTLLTQFVVNTLNDTVAVDLVTGTDANGAISLRSAVMAANSQIGPHTIVLSPTESNAPYLLTITGRNEDAAASGDLDLKGRITIEGHGATIDANSIDRVFETLGGANITLKNLNLDQGEALEGGVIYNRSRLTLNNVQTAGIVRSEGSAEGRGGAIYNAGSGRIVAQDSSIQGRAFGQNGDNGTTNSQGDATSGQAGGSVAGGAIYNLGSFISTRHGTIGGEAYAGYGGDGAAGLPGRDAFGTLSGTNGLPGANGGTGGSALGGAVYNGPKGIFQMTQGSIQGDAAGGAGGGGGEGGKGGDAGFWFSDDGGAWGSWGPREAAPGGNGGNAGNAIGGAVYNAGGTVNLSAAVGDNNPFQFIGRAMAFFGGHGGNGGQGGNGASLFVPPNNDIVIPPGNGANGGNGSKGGLALGGSIYSTGGTIQLNRVRVPGSGGNIGVYSGSGGSRGGGGAAAEEEREGSDGALGSAGRSEGGFLWSSAGTVQITDSEFEGIEAIGAYGTTGTARGGVLAISGATVSVTGTSFTSNRAEGGSSSYGLAGGSAYGGAIHVTAGSVNVSDSRFSGNVALGRSGSTSVTAVTGGTAGGAGLAVLGGTVTVNRSTFENGIVQGGDSKAALEADRGGNGGSAYGGGIYATGGALTVTNSTISGNTVLSAVGTTGLINGSGGTAAGGGVYATNATVSMSNITVYGNVAASAADPQAGFGIAGAARGGGIYHSGTGIITIDHATIAANRVGSATGATNALGGGLFNGTGTFQVHNSLVVLNVNGASASSTNRDVHGTYVSQGYNLIGVRNNATNFTSSGDRRGTATTPLNVKLGTLADNGGPTLTCAILPGSIAINFGAPLDLLAIDQRGIARPVNGRSDIGAYEVG